MGGYEARLSIKARGGDWLAVLQAEIPGGDLATATICG